MATLPISVRVLVAASFVIGAVGCGPVEEEDVCRWVLLKAGPEADAPDASDYDSILKMTRAFEDASGLDTFSEAAHNLELGVELLRAGAPETASGFIGVGLSGYADTCEPYWDQWSQLR